jgi:hypothetical protein
MNNPEIVLGETDKKGKPLRGIAFYGREIAFATDKAGKQKRKKGRWTNVRIFERDPPEGGFVVGIANLTRHIGQFDILSANYVHTKDEAVEVIARLAPPKLADSIIQQLNENQLSRERRDNKAVL